MEQLMTAIGLMFVAALLFCGMCVISGLCLEWAWNGVMGDLFPRVANVGVPLTITWWQAFKLSWLIGIIGGKFASSLKVEKKEG